MLGGQEKPSWSHDARGAFTPTQVACDAVLLVLLQKRSGHGER